MILGVGLVVFRGDLLMIGIGCGDGGLRICSGVDTLGVCSLCSYLIGVRG